jgi:hypothetical protein
LPVYRCYGFKIASDFSFATSLIRCDGPPDLEFVCRSSKPTTSELSRAKPIFESAARVDETRSLISLYAADGYDLLRFTEIADFYMWPDSIRCHLLDEAAAQMVEIYLLGLVFSVWLERQGIPALHASAAVVGDSGVAFLAGNRGGKSSLAATFVGKGCALLTDDILPLEISEGGIRGRPGYPQMRLWPPEARHFLGHDDLPLVHPHYTKRRVAVGTGSFGQFCDHPRRLAAVYVPQQQSDAAIHMEPVFQGDALIELVRHSFAAHIAEAMGLGSRRFRVLAEVVRRVPTRRLIYPPGMEHLDAVEYGIRQDLAHLGVSGTESG